MIVALAQQKGGSGKSTLCISLGVEAHVRGLQTLIVDADSQRTALVWAEVASEAGHSAPVVVGQGGAMHRPDQLPRLARDYDLVLVDLPPRIDTATRSALMVCDVVLLPAAGTPQDLWALSDTLRLVREAQELRTSLPAAVVINRAQGNTLLGRSARGALEASGLPVLRASLGQRVTFPESIAAGQAPTSYAPSSDAADEVRRLLNEVLTLGGAPRVKPKKTRSKAP